MTRLLSIVLLVWALLTGAASLWLDPAQTLEPATARAAALGLLVAAAGAAAAIGSGAALLSHLAPALLEDERGFLHSAVAGMLLWSLGALLLAAAGGLAPGPLACLGAVLALGWVTRPRLTWPRVPPLVALALLVVLVPGLVEALAPPTDTDELYYHLGLPKKMLDAAALVGGALDPSGNRPLLVHLPMATMLALGGETAPRLLHLVLSLGVVGATASLGRRHLGPGAGEVAALILAASWSFTRGAGILGTDMPAALAVLAALDAGLRGDRTALAIAAATALGAKYTAGGAIAGVFLVARLPLGARMLAGLGALALVSPWWVRNLLAGVHPLFPFAGWPELFPFQYLDKYGAGRDPVSMLLLPWNVSMSAEIDSFRFLGRVTPSLLALAPAAMWAAWARSTVRRLMVVSIALCVLWAAGPHLLRFLLPGLPILALTAGAGAARLLVSGPGGRLALAAVALTGLLGLPANLGPVFAHAGDRVSAATGTESRNDFLTRVIKPWPVIRWANEHLPADATVAVLYSWHGYLLERPTRLGSVEDHIPVRHWQLTHNGESLSQLRSAGVTHVLVDRQRFLQSAYPFVSEADLSALFRSPTLAWEDQLLMEGTLLYQNGGTRLFSLPPPAPRSRP